LDLCAPISTNLSFDDGGYGNAPRISQKHLLETWCLIEIHNPHLLHPPPSSAFYFRRPTLYTNARTSLYVGGTMAQRALSMLAIATAFLCGQASPFTLPHSLQRRSGSTDISLSRTPGQVHSSFYMAEMTFGTPCVFLLFIPQSYSCLCTGRKNSRFECHSFKNSN
jgi:hypothetical protein